MKVVLSLVGDTGDFARSLPLDAMLLDDLAGRIDVELRALAIPERTEHIELDRTIRSHKQHPLGLPRRCHRERRWVLHIECRAMEFFPLHGLPDGWGIIAGTIVIRI